MGKKNKEVKQNAPASSHPAAYLLRKVPYTSGYERLGMIETTPGTFTRAYEIISPDGEIKKDYDVARVRECMRDLLSSLTKDFSCQMLVRNSKVEKEVFLDQVLLPQHREREVNLCIEDYNNIIKDNVDIGHNNYRRTVYFILSMKADTADDAAEAFMSVDEAVKKKFDAMYGYVASPQTLVQRLHCLYDLFNPDGMEYKEFQKKMEENKKTPTKEFVCPATYDCKKRDYMKVGDKYVRMLFINSLPTSVPDSVLNDLMSVSSNSILSVLYEPIDTDFGYEVAQNHVAQNTKTRTIPIRDTVDDRKKHRMQEKKEPITEGEEQYFYQAASQLFQKAKENDEPVLLASFIIALFADYKEDLDRDTKLLKLSASKYASQIRICDLMQDDAFQSMLPLAQCKLNVYRSFRAGQLAAMQPLDVQQLFNRTKAFHGLNGISDNLILLDRQNYLSGIICGVEHSGKSFAMKREIANTLMTTNDDVILLTKDIESCEMFVRNMGGQMLDMWKPDVFSGENETLKKFFLEAFLTYRNEIPELRLTDAEKQEAYKAIEEQIEKLYQCDGWNKAIDVINNNRSAFSAVIKGLNGYKPTPNTDFDSTTGRFKVLSIASDDELVWMLYAAANYCARCQQMGKMVWVYVDYIDGLMYSTPGSDFLIKFLELTEEMKMPVTMVVQDSVHIIANDNAVIEYDYLMKKISYYKLLSQGPVERRKYVDRLNIPESLVTYITDREPGEGIIITPSANIAFNDRFERRDNPFYARFY